MAKKAQGFSYLKKHDPDRLKEISSKGGTAAQNKGTGHKWTPDAAKSYGREGGQTRWRKQGKG